MRGFAAGGEGFAVASPHAVASYAGREVFGRGGNAVDAALAAAITLTVVYPHQCAVGGDLIALVGLPDGTKRAINASGAAPAAVEREALAARYGRVPITGAHAVTVPGVVDGWATLSRLAGRLDFGGLFALAIDCARDGVPVSPGLAAALREHEPLLAEDEGMREVFFKTGELPDVGQILRQPALARTLEAIAQGGPEAFYHGPIGHSVVRTLRERGAPFSMEDLGKHQTAITDPLTMSFRGQDFHTAPPNSQGVHFLQILGALEMLGAEYDPLGRDADVLARLFAATSADRDRVLADPRHAADPSGELLSEAGLRRLLDRIRTPLVRPPASVRPSGDTTAIVAADADGHFVSLIQSLFHGFGSGILDTDTGVILHNRGAFFSAEKGHPNEIAPGKRPAHTLMPVLTSVDGVTTGAHGCMGGKAQPQIHTHFALSLAAGTPIAETLRRPRWVVGELDAGTDSDAVRVEPALPAAALAALERSGLPVSTLGELDDETGHGQLVRRLPDGTLRAASDPRADGAAMAG